MRSGRGKCPQCKEIIVVDLDAAEIRCPLCNALLKKSSKTVEEVRAEEEARIAAAQAREQALAEEAAAAAETTPEEVAEAPSEPVAEAPAEEVSPEEVSAEESQEEQAPVDEIGLSDEELAAMDETIPEEVTEDSVAEEADIDVPAAEEEQAEKPVDEIGLSDEELAAMDEVIPAEIAAEPVEEAAEADIPAPAEAEDAAPEEIDIPVESDEVAEEDAAEIDDVLPTDEVAAEDASTEEAPTEDIPVEAADIDVPAEENPAEEIPVEVTDDVPTQEAPVETVDDIPTEIAAEPAAKTDAEALVLEENEEDRPSEKDVEEALAEEIPLEEPTEEQPEEESNEYVPTEEDMAFAASLSEGNKREQGKGYFIPVVNAGAPVDKKDKKEKKAKKEKKVADKGANVNENAIYKKPVALIITILSVLTAAFFFLYYKVLTIGFISESLMTKVSEALPTFGGDNFSLYVQTIFVGLLAVISILGITGKRGRVAFIFVLLADLVYAAQTVLLGYVDIPKLAEILLSYGEYVQYGVFGLLLIGAIFFAGSIIRGSDEFEIRGGTAILPLIYLALALVGYAALVVLPRILSDFSVTTEIEHYVIYGIWGLALLLTLVGVHNAQSSRGANAWLLFAATIIIVLLYGASVVLTKMDAGRNLEIYPEIFYAVSPVIALFPLAGFAASDMRN